MVEYNMPEIEKPTTWQEQGVYVLSEIKRINNLYLDRSKVIDGKLDNIVDRQGQVMITLATLNERIRLRSGVWGLLGGLIPALIALIYFILKESH